MITTSLLATIFVPRPARSIYMKKAFVFDARFIC